MIRARRAKRRGRARAREGQGEGLEEEVQGVDAREQLEHAQQAQEPEAADRLKRAGALQAQLQHRKHVDAAVQLVATLAEVAQHAERAHAQRLLSQKRVHEAGVDALQARRVRGGHARVRQRQHHHVGQDARQHCGLEQRERHKPPARHAAARGGGHAALTAVVRWSGRAG